MQPMLGSIIAGDQDDANSGMQKKMNIYLPCGFISKKVFCTNVCSSSLAVEAKLAFSSRQDFIAS